MATSKQVPIRGCPTNLFVSKAPVSEHAHLHASMLSGWGLMDVIAAGTLARRGRGCLRLVKCFCNVCLVCVCLTSSKWSNSGLHWFCQGGDLESKHSLALCAQSSVGQVGHLAPSRKIRSAGLEQNWPLYLRYSFNWLLGRSSRLHRTRGLVWEATPRRMAAYRGYGRIWTSRGLHCWLRSILTHSAYFSRILSFAMICRECMAPKIRRGLA